MKKQFFILLLLIIHLLSIGQGDNNIKTELPCTDAMAQDVKGKWIQTANNGTYNTKETNSRLDEIHNMILKMYPQPTGMDIVWHRTAGMSYFGSKHKYYKTNDDRLTFDYLNLPHFTYYYYNAGFFNYQCEYGKTNSLMPTYPGETGTFLNVIANVTIGSMSQDDNWTINGLPVKMYKASITSADGIDVLYPEPGRNVYEVLIHRKGILPYTPVTRKQYLDYCIIFHTKINDEVIKNYEKMPVRSLEDQEKEKRAKLAKFEKDFANDPKKLKANVDYYLSGYQTDQDRRNELIIKTKKNRDDIVKKFIDEVEKTTNEGLLGVPALVLTMYQHSPSVFETDLDKASMLIIENPDYIRKDLPKYVPQFFIAQFAWNEWMPYTKFAAIFKEKFPFDKLQAMIDK
ncbi:MAG TPA: hypothetical protein VFT15_05020 [Chitinophagaceae bacterium]|nr:hypothetical protein [Chitinophagaceae bacterium]